MNEKTTFLIIFASATAFNIGYYALAFPIGFIILPLQVLMTHEFFKTRSKEHTVVVK